MSKRNQILTAAETILAEHGFYGFSMQNLADAADVATGTIYRYFENKEALMNELQKFIQEDAAHNVFAGWQDSLSCKQKYDLMWQNTFNAVLKNPKRLTVIEMLHCVPNLNTEKSEITLFEDGPFKGLIEFYQQGIDNKQFLDWQLCALIAVSFDTSITLAKKVIRGRLIPEQQQLDQVRDASWAIIQNPHFKK
ncbi:TetR/AcrR family transcriptional regulator [Psychromonas sp. RZ22]|uniref:TetR/AcrR family transcriptional regulator n=1 Tax=Psychromonas algarum TaxID=2555643 RepID=UPI001067786E|nr:TetR/AcrR family transcriptional regulator [Psychromonas sp. RZ22]TEW54218.1 TetR/AcrR family transcriptional regulator [Psychromonas sp. RZ22]